MAELEAAKGRLIEALRRLEGALAARFAQPPPGSAAENQRALARITAERDALARDLGVLRSECDRLSAALGETERDNHNLRDVTTHVAQRLNGSISELDRLLEG